MKKVLPTLLLLVASSLLAQQSQEPSISNEVITIEPGVKTEVPLFSLFQMPTPMEGFWWNKADGSPGRLCVRAGYPNPAGVITFIGWCFSAEELNSFPQIHQPKKK